MQDRDKFSLTNTDILGIALPRIPSNHKTTTTTIMGPTNEDLFMLFINEIHKAVSGHGIMVTGAVDQGVIKPGDELDIVTENTTIEVICTGLEASGRTITEAKISQTVSVFLDGVDAEEVRSCYPHLIWGFSADVDCSFVWFRSLREIRLRQGTCASLLILTITTISWPARWPATI